MRLTEELLEEHKTIRLAVRMLKKICERIETGTRVDGTDLDMMVGFIDIYVERIHHRKEEDLLFSTMEKEGVPTEAGAVGLMLVEHKTLRDYSKTMSEATARYKAGDSQALIEFCHSALLYLNLLNEDIELEESDLYTRAEIHLSKRKQEELLNEFKRIDKFGAAKEKQLDNLLSLKRIYQK
jgi:hemerythrin-like domain-containing protein